LTDTIDPPSKGRDGHAESVLNRLLYGGRTLRVSFFPLLLCRKAAASGFFSTSSVMNGIFLVGPMHSAVISGQILVWARERANLAPEVVSSKAKVNLDKLFSWESGKGYPSFKQAQKLASVLRIPFGYFFLSQPPKETIPLPDLRQIKPMGDGDFSADFLEVVGDALRKQQWYKEYLTEEGSKPLEFIAKYRSNTNPEFIASEIRTIFGIDNSLRSVATSWTDFFRRLISVLESKGITVQRSGIVGSNTRRALSVDEFRGFAISDNVAPLIFINGRDFKAAQIFTLAHELAHLLIGESGISNSSVDTTINRLSNAGIEQLCNEIAAEVLVPKDEILSSWKRQDAPGNNVDRLVRHFRVSTIVILRRALDLGLISKKIFIEEINLAWDRIRKAEDNSSESGGGDFYKTFYARNGRELSHSIISAAIGGRILYLDAANYLGVKVKTISNIAKDLGMVH